MNKILIVAPDSMGIIPVIISHIKSYKGITADLLDLDTFKNRFRYKNHWQRVQNFFSKIIFRKNLKHIFFNQQVKQGIDALDSTYKIIIIIRPDLIDNTNLAYLRSKTTHFAAYYWDSICFFRRKAAIIPFFDVVYSFDEEDCKQYGLKLLTNFYFYEKKETPVKYDVYNLTTLDYRINDIARIAALLHRKNISFLFKTHTQKTIRYKHIVPFSTLLNYEAMLKEIAAANCLLEVQKDKQHGLTFRPFEALGLNIKLITTNAKIKEYDFYDTNNILVIDKYNIVIPDDFFTTPYRPVSEQIKKKYNINTWIDTILAPYKEMH